MGEWFLQSLDFFKHSIENSKLVKGEKLLKLLTNYEFLLFTSFCLTLACTTPARVKRRTVCRPPESVWTDYIQIPQIILEWYHLVMMAVEVMPVNNVPFLVSVAWGLNLITANFFPTRTAMPPLRSWGLCQRHSSNGQTNLRNSVHLSHAWPSIRRPQRSTFPRSSSGSASSKRGGEEFSTRSPSKECHTQCW
jgi:hypothetical protein